MKNMNARSKTEEYNYKGSITGWEREEDDRPL